MKYVSSARKLARTQTGTSSSGATAGPEGIAIAPPAAILEDVDAQPDSAGPDQLYEQQPPEPIAQRHPLTIQAKFIVTGAGDVHEREADCIAHQVMSQKDRDSRPGTVPSRGPTRFNIQRSGGGAGFNAPPAVERGIRQARGGGRSLPQPILKSMGQSFGADFTGVRAHTDSRANRLNQSIQSRAFTAGQDIFFKQGEYKPNSEDGQKLIAHELTHVVQQNSDFVQRQKDYVIQRTVVDEDGVVQDEEDVEEYLTENGIDEQTAKRLAWQYAVGTQGYVFRSDLLNVPPSGNLKDFAEQFTKLDNEKLGDGWVDRKSLAKVLRKILVLDAKIGKRGVSEENKRAKLGIKETLEAVATTCDVNAYILMVGAVGIEEIEAIKRKYDELYQQRMKDPKDKITQTETENGKAYLYLRGEANQLRETWTNWSKRPGNGVMKVKFNHTNAGPHTFVIERTRGKVALYQAYEGKYTLAQSLKGFKSLNGSTVSLPKSGVLVEPSEVGNNQIDLICKGLGTPEDVQALANEKQPGKITNEGYKRAFGAPLKNSWEMRYGAAIQSVALFTFESLLSPSDVNKQLKNKFEDVNYYEEIIPVKQYEKEIINTFSKSASKEEIEEQSKRVNELSKQGSRLPKFDLKNLKLNKAKTHVRHVGGSKFKD